MAKETFLWQKWLYGLVWGFISAGAGSVGTTLAGVGLKPDAFNFTTQLGSAMKLALASFLINGIIWVTGYLKQSPLPALVEETTTIVATQTASVTKTVETTPIEAAAAVELKKI